MGGDLLWNDVLDNLSEGVYIINREGNYTYANHAFLKMSYGRISDLPKLNIFNTDKEPFTTRKSAVLSAFQEKKRVTLINSVVNYRGYRYRQLVSAIPIFDDMGEVGHVIVEMINLDTLQQNLQKAARVEDEESIDWIHEVEKGTAFVASSPIMQTLLAQAREIAQVDSTVLIQGETGTGKEVLAHFIHDSSKRRNHKMIEVNCAALPENLLESELFGYEKGAFTNAVSTGRDGLVKAADGGTLFLDEINSLPLALQGKLLRVLETKKLKRLGSTKEVDVDFRLVVASNADLFKCVEDGNFRADLYYRIAVVPLKVPPLRHRKEDIVPLALHFLSQYCQKYGREKILTNSALEQLTSYDWPGNVRELKNVIEAMVVTVAADTLEIRRMPEHLFKQMNNTQPAPVNEDFTVTWEEYCATDREDFTLQGYLEYCEKKVLTEVLKTHGSTRKAASVLKVDQSTIVRKKQKYGIE